MNFEDEKGIQIAGLQLSDRSLARMGWLMPLLTVVFSMSVHLLSGNARDVPFFISESDYPGVERWIFTSGLAINGVILSILSYRFKKMFHASKQPNRVRLSFYSGLITGVSLFVLAFANMYDFLFLHCVAAFFVFGGGLVWGGSTHLLFDSTNSEGRTLRRIGLVLALLGFIVMNLSLTAYLLLNRDDLTKNGSLRLTLNELQPAIDFAAPAEFILFLGLVITMASIDWDLKEKNTSHSSD